MGVARRHMGVLRLDEARTLLDFLEKPGAEHLYSLEPLEILADKYRANGQHAPALELYGRLLAGLPAIGQIAAFRKKVQASEKALRPAVSLLPKRKWSWKNLFGDGTARRSRVRGLGILGILLLLVGAGFIVANEYIRRHRTIYVVNATTADTREVRLAGLRKPGAPPGVASIELPEGSYRVWIGGAKPEEFDLDVRTDYWSRWGGDPVWLINVGGAALLIAEHVTFRRDPPPSNYSLHFGKTSEQLQLEKRFQLRHKTRAILPVLFLHHGRGMRAGQQALVFQAAFREQVAEFFHENLARLQNFTEHFLPDFPHLAIGVRHDCRAARLAGEQRHFAEKIPVAQRGHLRLAAARLHERLSLALEAGADADLLKRTKPADLALPCWTC